MIDQRRFAPECGRIKSESVAGYAGISTEEEMTAMSEMHPT